MIAIRYEGMTYSNIFESVEWSGSIKTSCRTLEVVYLKDKVKFELGKEIEFIVDNQILFIGIIFTISDNTNDETMTMKAYDNAIRLNKNSFIANYVDMLPSKIVENILGQLKIDVGELPIDRCKCTFPAIDRTGYEIILSAYKIQHSKDNKVYSIISENKKISVVEQGILIPDVVLASNVNVRNATYSQSIEDMINKVIIYETNNGQSKTIATKENKEDVIKYGPFQRVQEQDDSNEVLLQIQNLLKGVQESSDLTVDGNIYLMSGYNVPVKISSISRLNANFLIETDKHIWSSGDYTTYLSLAFENVMNDIDVQVAKKRTTYKAANLHELGEKGGE